MKIIVAPDSFKGTLTAVQVADIITAEVLAHFPDCQVVKMPLADGGEGSIETILAAGTAGTVGSSGTGGTIHTTEVLSPDSRKITANFGIMDSGRAVLEVAQSSGITKQNGLHPMTSNTYGFGQMILAALDLGLRDFILCIGGSATTDGGCGMAAALGVKFFDATGKSFIPSGGTLCDIARIDTNGMEERVHTSTFTVMCDVDNPLFGLRGAAQVFGPQKGADASQVLDLDTGLQHLNNIWIETFGTDCSQVPGAGAAGGLGAGSIVFLGAKLESGIDAILDLHAFQEQLTDADLIITGEGKLDSQSLSGKVLSGILRRAGAVPVISICGVCDCDADLLQSHGLVVYQTSEGISASESMQEPEKYLKLTAAKTASSFFNQPRSC
jgi:glycerate kinase